MKIDIKGKKALVTGASRGIGKAIAGLLLEAGAVVVGTARDPKRLGDFTREFESYKDQLTVIPADLNKREEIERLCKTVDEQIGDLDIIVNNAGVFHFELLSGLTEEMLTSGFAVNVFAPIRICKYFVPSMVQNKWGRVINICSSSAYTGGGTPRHCIYSSTKHALLGFSRALDEELREHNIRVGIVSPAGVATDMIKGRKDLNPDSFMSSKDVAEAVMYLVTSDGPGIVYEMYMHRMHR